MGSEKDRTIWLTNQRHGHCYCIPACLVVRGHERALGVASDRGPDPARGEGAG